MELLFHNLCSILCSRSRSPISQQFRVLVKEFVEAFQALHAAVRLFAKIYHCLVDRQHVIDLLRAPRFDRLVIRGVISVPNAGAGLHLSARRVLLVELRFRFRISEIALVE